MSPREHLGATAPGRGGGEGVRIRDHLANVRTMLAWWRAGVTLLALGYVMRKLQLLAGLSGATGPFGIVVSLGGLLLVAGSTTRFLLQRRLIEGEDIRTRPIVELAMVAICALAGLAVLVFLLAVRLP